MTPIKTIKATPDNPHPLPPHGGDWQREADGSLTLLQATAPAATEPAPPPAKPSSKQPAKE